MAEAVHDPEPAASVDAEAHPTALDAVTDEVMEGSVRRSPRYAVFMVLGAALGILVALILTFAFNGNAEPADNGRVYSDGEVFGFLALAGVVVGLAVGGIVAIVLDRIMGRRARSVRVEHETVERLG